jgi:hypothetical protein
MESHNKIIFIEKKVDDKNILATLKKHILLKMWNYKTLTIQRMFQNCFRISKLQESFTTYKWAIMYMMYEKNYNFNYNNTKEYEILIFGDDLKF